MGWASPRARVPLGEAVGGISVPSGNVSLCSVPTTSALLYWLELPGKLKGKVDCLPKAPGQGGVETCQTPASGQAPPQVLCSSYLPDFPTFVACCVPSQPPKGTDHLATIVYDLGPQISTEGLLEGVKALVL